MDNIIDCLDKPQTAYETYKKSEMYWQPNDISISDLRCSDNQMTSQYQIWDVLITKWHLNIRFEMYWQPNNISDFINEFGRLLNKTGKYGSNISSDILAYAYQKPLTILNILNSQYHECHFIKMSLLATIPELKYQVMKTLAKKIFVTIEEETLLKTSCWT